jgi:hypothetical protein
MGCSLLSSRRTELLVLFPREEIVEKDRSGRVRHLSFYPERGVILVGTLLDKTGRLILAGLSCPFRDICPDAKTCNRPQNMHLTFSCATARTFDRLQMGGSLLQAKTIDDLSSGSATKGKPDAEDIIEELNLLPDPDISRGRPKKQKPTSFVKKNRRVGSHHRSTKKQE